MLRQAESRLNRDKEAMLAEQRNQNLLLTNLKTIQVPNHTTTETSHFAFILFVLKNRQDCCCNVIPLPLEN